MDYIIGDAIRKKIEEKGMTFVSFADKFGITDRNLQYLFKKSDLTLQQVVRASEILSFDFVTEYLKNKKSKFDFQNIEHSERPPKTKVKSENVTMSINLSAEITTYAKNFPEFLKNLSMEASKFGFTLL
nr:hypothetical protein [Pedobacter sp. ASV19]